MVDQELDEAQLIEELTRWFVRRLDESDVNVEDETLSYDCNSAYDVLFFRLQSDAQSFCKTEYGFVPSPDQLANAFFNAEYQRSRRDRLTRRGWVARFGDFLGVGRRPA